MVPPCADTRRAGTRCRWARAASGAGHAATVLAFFGDGGSQGCAGLLAGDIDAVVGAVDLHCGLRVEMLNGVGDGALAVSRRSCPGRRIGVAVAWGLSFRGGWDGAS